MIKRNKVGSSSSSSSASTLMIPQPPVSGGDKYKKPTSPRRQSQLSLGALEDGIRFGSFSMSKLEYYLVMTLLILWIVPDAPLSSLPASSSGSTQHLRGDERSLGEWKTGKSKSLEASPTDDLFDDFEWELPTSAAAAGDGGSKAQRRLTEAEAFTATVIGFDSGYGLAVYKRFVGSLRKTGFRGNIIMAVTSDLKEDVIQYLQARQVRLRNVTVTSEHCAVDDEPFCSSKYPQVKYRWSRIPLVRDWLQSCTMCMGPVLLTDVRDTLFQSNPFEAGMPAMEGLQLFEEHANHTTVHPSVQKPLKDCKSISLEKPMLSSSTVAGTRDAMLHFTSILYEEMKAWVASKCEFDFVGAVEHDADDQPIVNYLFYTGQLPFAEAIPHRHGMVHSVGFEAIKILEAHTRKGKQNGLSDTEARMLPLAGSSTTRRLWIPTTFGLTNEEGFLVNADGTKSPVVHQYDQFGEPFELYWLVHQDFIKDDLQPNEVSWFAKRAYQHVLET